MNINIYVSHDDWLWLRDHPEFKKSKVMQEAIKQAREQEKK